MNLELGDRIAGRYRLVQLLGRGGMGVVYEAHDELLDETVALKTLGSAEDAAGLHLRLQSEIKLARKVSHPNVCRIHDYGQSDGLAYITMELIDGLDLRRCLDERGLFGPEATFDILLQIAAGLAAVHRAGIIHRDLKSRNVMLDRAGRAQVMDFGLARPVAAIQRLTAAGNVVGTPHYMSPEQARGHDVDVRADVYSFGILAFELFTGALPFTADSPMAVVLKHLREPPPLRVGAGTALPEGVVPVLERALAKAPEQRYASIDEMAAALQAARLPTRPLSLVMDGPTAHQWSGDARGPRRRHGLLLLGLSGAALAALGAIAWLAWPGKIVTPSPTAIVGSASPRSSPLPSPSNSSLPPRASPSPAELHPPPRRAQVLLPRGAHVRVSIAEELRSDRLQPGQRFRAVLSHPVELGLTRVFQAGTLAEGRVEYATTDSMALTLTAISRGERLLPVETKTIRLAAPSEALRAHDGRAQGGRPLRARPILIGALLGAAVGALTDGRRGAAEGALAGAAAGAALDRGGAHDEDEPQTTAYRLNNALTFQVTAELLDDFGPD